MNSDGASQKLKKGNTEHAPGAGKNEEKFCFRFKYNRPVSCPDFAYLLRCVLLLAQSKSRARGEFFRYDGGRGREDEESFVAGALGGFREENGE